MKKRMAHRFSVRHVVKEREPFGNYEYEVLDNETVIARYQHDYRGDEAGITFVDGNKRRWPFACVTDVVVGGGPQPLGLSDAAIAWLNENLAN